jgi:hypothetical protein
MHALVAARPPEVKHKRILSLMKRVVGDVDAVWNDTDPREARRRSALSFGERAELHPPR